MSPARFLEEKGGYWHLICLSQFEVPSRLAQLPGMDAAAQQRRLFLDDRYG